LWPAGARVRGPQVTSAGALGKTFPPRVWTATASGILGPRLRGDDSHMNSYGHMNSTSAFRIIPGRCPGMTRGLLGKSDLREDFPVVIVIVLEPLHGLGIADRLEHPEIAIEIELELRIREDLVEGAGPERDLLGTESVRYQHGVGIGGDDVESLLAQRRVGFELSADPLGRGH